MGLFDAAGYNLTVTPELLGLPAGTGFALRSLWERKDLGKFDGASGAPFWLDALSITMLKVTPLP